MKKRILSLALAGCLLLSGCTAMLERSYSVTAPHADRPITAEDPSVLRVENYRELVSAVLYLVSRHDEEGIIQLHNYDGDEEGDLTAACLEVSTQDPLGAYAVDYIKHDLARVVSYYQATLAIRYRRSEGQMRSIVSVNGNGAIRDRLQTALAGFAAETVLRVPYFFGDEDTVVGLLREAYYAHPDQALGLPQAEVRLYPDSGRERIVELTLTYPEEVDTLREKRGALIRRVAELPGTAAGTAEEVASLALDILWETAVYDPEGGATAYHALVEGRADSEGMALAFALLCGRGGLPCRVEQGELGGAPRFWVVLEPPGGEMLWCDPAEESDAPLHSREEFDSLGYFLVKR